MLRRNSVERLKVEKHPYDILNDLSALMEAAYEAIPEEDILRLQWYGLYHDKPKLGNFMLRVKVPNGILNPAQLRTIGRLSVEHGAGSGELTTRQDIQLHYVRLPSLPALFADLEAVGLTTAGGCGDNVRNITGCPAAGLDPEELFDVTPVVREMAAYYSGNREFGNLPRKHKYTIAACPFHCNGPEIHDVALIGVMQNGRPGFAFQLGGGLSSVPRIGKNLGVFVPLEEAFAAARGLTDLWRQDLRYRVSRARARFKFMVDDDGVEVLREKLEVHLGRRLEDLEQFPAPLGRTAHMGIQPQKAPAGHSGPPLFMIGFPCFPGLMSGEQMQQLADLIEGRGEFRITREQNFLLTHVPEAGVEDLVAAVAAIGFPLRVNPVRGTSIACTGDPHCNFALGDTKPDLVQIVTHLEDRFGDAISDLRVYLDGCPHACGQHWVGDLGFQGTSRNTDTGKVSAYDILVRGKLGPDAAIGRPLLRRIPTPQVNECVERLVGAWLEGRAADEGLPEFYRRQPDEQVLAIAEGRSPAAP